MADNPDKRGGGGKKKGKGKGKGKSEEGSSGSSGQAASALQAKPPTPQAGAAAQAEPSSQAKSRPQTKPTPQAESVAQVTSDLEKKLVVSQSTQSQPTQSKKDLYTIPRRSGKDGGTRGVKIQVDTNHFGIKFDSSNLTIVHYDVAIEPEKPVRYMRPVLMKTAETHFRGSSYGYDNKKNLFTKGLLPFGHELEETVTIFDDENQKDREFKIKIQYAQNIMFSMIEQFMKSGVDKPQIAIQALDVILREPCVANPRFVRVGRSYFTKPEPRYTVDLGDGMHLWHGFYQSAGIGWRPFLNVDVAHKGFPEEKTIIDVIKDLNNGNTPASLQDYIIDLLKSRVGGLKVKYEIPNQPNTSKIYKVNRIVGDATRERFKIENAATDTTIADYFARNKAYRLRFPYWPCFQVGSIQRNNRVPAELCTIVGGQVTMKKLNERQTSQMVRNAATSTDVRRKKVMDAVRNANYGGSKILRDFGINISGDMERVNARIIKAPKVTYKNNQQQLANIPVEKGVWKAEKFLTPMSIKTWAILDLSRRNTGNYKLLIDQLPKGAVFHGMIFAQRPIEVIESNRDNERNAKQIFTRLKSNLCDLVFVIIPPSGDTYSKVKQVAEQEVGILTQCIKESTLLKLNAATTTNIVLKLNAKMNGTNHSVLELKKPGVLSKPTIVFGADVTHPSPDEVNIPSIAAVTASYDANAFQYNMMWYLQDPKKEVLEKLQEIVRSQLQFFFQRNKVKPQHIIFYRDGVSEGQFQQIITEEVQAIKRAAASLEQNYNPKITFLLVQKRHHTRFFPRNPNEGDNSKNNNVKPGTIVDTTITHPMHLDFYLVSHQSIQGTARPTKYYRLWDDASMTDDDVEEMTYYFCHLFTRCTRAVSYPAPTYYAHLAAFRGRNYIKNKKLNLYDLTRENQIQSVKQDFLAKNPMYFV